MKIILFGILLLSFPGSLENIYAQKFYEEPEFTTGLQNYCFCNDAITGIAYAFDFNNPSKSEIIKRGKFIEVLLINFQEENLKHLHKYGVYAVTNDSKRINTVSSIQDNKAPEFTQMPHIINKSNSANNWCKTKTVQISFEVKDAAGIGKIYLYKKFKDENWPYSGIVLHDYYPDVTMAPGQNSVAETLSYSFEKEGSYEIFLGARDASHDPQSHSENPLLKGNLFAPNSTSEYHDLVRIDITSPASSFEPPENKFITLDSFILHLTADDPESESIESGLNSVSIYYYFKPYNTSVDSERHFYNKLIFNEKKSGLNTSYIFKPSEAMNEGLYWLYAVAVDNALNRQSDSTFIPLVVDVTPPRLNSLTLKDVTTDPTEFTTIAQPGWTNKEVVWADNDATDSVAGLDSLHFSGNLKPTSFDTTYTKHLKITLTQLNELNTVYLAISDSAGNRCNNTSTSITHDSTAPRLTGLVLQDLDGNTTQTNSWQVKVIPQLGDPLDPTLFKYALFETLPESFEERDSKFTMDIQNTLNYTFTDSSHGEKKLYCAVRDSAGNVSNVDSCSIQYVEPIIINNFVLTDLDLASDRNQFWTNNLQVQAEITLSRLPSEAALFLFFKEEDFTSPFDTIYFTEMNPVNDLTFQGTLNLPSDSQDGLQKIWVQLEDPPMGETSAAIFDTITLDLQPPVFIGKGLILRDRTQADDLNNLIFKAEPGWTNSTKIKALISITYDKFSGCDSLKFSGQIDPGNKKTSCCDSTELQLLPLERPANQQVWYKIYVTTEDAAGNVGNSDLPASVDSADITFENSQPTFNFQKPPDNTQLPAHTESIEIMVSFYDSISSKNLSRVILWETPDVPQQHIIQGNSQNDTTVIFTFAGSGWRTIKGTMIDSAGNFSQIKYLHIYNPKQPLEIPFQLFDSRNLSDSQFTGTQNVKVNFDTSGTGFEPDSAIACPDCTFSAPQCRWQPIDVNLSITGIIDSVDGEKTLWAKCKDSYPIISITTSASIILDTTPPELTGIELTDPSNLDHQSTVSQTIQVTLLNPRDPPHSLSLDNLGYILLTEDSSFASYDSLEWHRQASNYTFTLSSGNGHKTVFARLRDRAENESRSVVSNKIFLDSEKDKVYNVPNPFNPFNEGTDIIVRQEGYVDIKIYDLFGNYVRKLESEDSQSMRQSIHWDGCNASGDVVADGVYIAVIKNGDHKPERIKIAVSKGKN